MKARSGGLRTQFLRRDREVWIDESLKRKRKACRAKVGQDRVGSLIGEAGMKMLTWRIILCFFQTLKECLDLESEAFLDERTRIGVVSIELALMLETTPTI